MQPVRRREFHLPETPVSPQTANPSSYAPPYKQHPFQWTSLSSQTLPSELQQHSSPISTVRGSIDSDGDPHTTKPVRKPKGYPPEMPVSSASSYPQYVPPYQPQPSQGIVHKELFILHYLIHCHHLRNQELTEAPRLGMVQIVLYIGAIVYIGTIPVAGILHPLSTCDNLQLVPHPRRDIIYKTRPQAPHVFTIRLVIIIHPLQERRIWLLIDTAKNIWRCHSGWWCALWWWTTTVFSWCFIRRQLLDREVKYRLL